MLKEIKILGNLYSCPVGWDDISVSRFLEIAPKLRNLLVEEIQNKVFDSVEFVSIVLRCDYDIAINAPAEVLQDIQFIRNIDFSIIKPLKNIEIQGKKIKIPKEFFDLNKEQKLLVGQLESFRSITKRIENKYHTDEIKTIINKQSNKEELTLEEIDKIAIFNINYYYELAMNCHKLSSHVLQPLFDKKYIPENIEKFSVLLLTKPVSEIFKIAFFLLIRLTM